MKKLIMIFLVLSNFTFAYANKGEDSYFIMAKAAMKAGHIDVAIELFKKEVQKNPRNYQALSKLGVLQFKQKKYEIGLLNLNASYELNPLSVDTSFNLAYMYRDQKKTELALKFFKRADSLRPGIYATKIQLAHVYEELDDFKSAKIEYANALKIEPNNTKRLESYAAFLVEHKYYQEAELEYKKAIALEGSNLYAVTLALGKLLDDHSNKWKEAISTYHQLADIDEDSIEAFYLSGLVYEKHSKWKKAIGEFKTLLEINDKSVQGNLHLAGAYQFIDEQDLALKHYLRTIELDKMQMTPYEKLAFIYIEREQFDKAGKKLFEMTSVNPSYVNAYVYRGWLHEIVGTYSRAEKEYQKALTLSPNDQGAMESLANLYYTLNHIPAATKLYAKLVEMKNHSKMADHRHYILDASKRVPAAIRIE